MNTTSMIVLTVLFIYMKPGASSSLKMKDSYVQDFLRASKHRRNFMKNTSNQFFEDIFQQVLNPDESTTVKLLENPSNISHLRAKRKIIVPELNNNPALNTNSLNSHLSDFFGAFKRIKHAVNNKDGCNGLTRYFRYFACGEHFR